MSVKNFLNRFVVGEQLLFVWDINKEHVTTKETERFRGDWVVVRPRVSNVRVSKVGWWSIAGGKIGRQGVRIANLTLRSYNEDRERGASFGQLNSLSDPTIKILRRQADFKLVIQLNSDPTARIVSVGLRLTNFSRPLILRWGSWEENAIFGC